MILFLLSCGRVAATDPHAGHGPPALAGEPAMPMGVTVAPEVATALGVRVVSAREGHAAIPRRAPATVAFDPTRTTRVTLPAGGQLRELRVPRVGEPVRRGDVLARAWLPEVRAAFEELLVARSLGEPWTAAARGRLLALGVPASELDAATAPETWTVRAPVSGLVVTRPAREGGWLGPGGLVAEIAAADARVVELAALDPPRIGAAVRLSAGDQGWDATVTDLLPTAGSAGRGVRLDVEGDPPVGAPLTATWYDAGTRGVWVPRGAVVDTGARQVVFVAAMGGFEPRPVVLGARTADEVQILSGIAPGEEVVAAGTFLFDAETQMQGGGHAGHGS